MEINIISVSSFERLFATVVTLMSFNNVNNVHNYKINNYIYVDVSNSDNNVVNFQIDVIKKLLPNTSVILSSQCDLYSDINFSTRENFNQWHKVIYTKYQFLKTVSQKSYTIIVDNDILFTKPIKPYLVNDYHLIGKPLTEHSLNVSKIAIQEFFGSVDTNIDKLGINAGVMIFTPKFFKEIRVTDFVTQLFQNISTMLAKSKYINDEIPLLLTNFQNKIKVDQNRYIQAYPHDSFSLQTISIHAGGKDKFWNNSLFRLYFPAWYTLYNQYLTAGGKPFSTPNNIAPVEMKSHRDSFFSFSLSSFWLNNLINNIHILTPLFFIESEIFSNILKFKVRNHGDIQLTIQTTGGGYATPDKLIFRLKSNEYLSLPNVSLLSYCSERGLEFNRHDNELVKKVNVEKTAITQTMREISAITMYLINPGA